MDLHDRWLKMREIRQGCAFWGFRQKIAPTQYPPNSENVSLRKQFFAQNTYKSWRKRFKNSYSNRTQPMGISNLRFLTGSSFIAVSACSQLRYALISALHATVPKRKNRSTFPFRQLRVRRKLTRIYYCKHAYHKPKLLPHTVR